MTPAVDRGPVDEEWNDPELLGLLPTFLGVSDPSHGKERQLHAIRLQLIYRMESIILVTPKKYCDQQTKTAPKKPQHSGPGAGPCTLHGMTLRAGNYPASFHHFESMSCRGNVVAGRSRLPGLLLPHREAWVRAHKNSGPQL